MAKAPRSRRVSTGGITLPGGFLAAGGTAGIKASGKPDLALVVAQRPCTAAGVFTRNKLPGAHVTICKKHLQRGRARAILCNSGCANDATGQQGLKNAIQCCRWTAEQVNAAGLGAGVEKIDPHEVLPASTGVIGPQLPMAKMRRGIAELAGRLKRGPGADDAAARAIMTTDLVPKTAVRRMRLGGKAVTVAGMAKGSGMIAPNMATMLVFITTDAAIRAVPLRAALRAAVAVSFNRISVDFHTSPSDTVLVLASGAAGNRPIARTFGRAFAGFQRVLTEVCRDLAYQIVKDGEGATKVFRVRVRGARNEAEADAIGRSVVNSPLVKTAVHGGDPNWGRIVTAAANAPAQLDPRLLSLRIGQGRAAVRVFLRGQPVEAKGRRRGALRRLMRAKEVVFDLDLGLGGADVEWLGCDLSRQYIAINADYTT